MDQEKRKANYDGEAMAEEMHRARMARTMQRPIRGDSVQKLVTRIYVEATEEEMDRLMPGATASPEEVVAWARAETNSAILARRAKWRAFWALQPPPS